MAESSDSKVPSAARQCDGDERAAGAQREAVEGLGDDFFAGAVLAGDEDVGIRGPMRVMRSRTERMAGAEAMKSGVPSAQEPVLGLEQGGAAECAVELTLGTQDGEQPRVVPWLLDEVRRATAHGFDIQVDVGEGGRDDDGEGRVAGANGSEQVEAFPAGGGIAGVVQIDEQAVEGVGGEVLEDGG